ncbi:sulfatase [Labilibacter sediminis]|nr:sulfatase [Labilibacter sediminis]
MSVYKNLFAICLIALISACGLSNRVEAKRPNVLFITVDDMNWNSVGAFGCKIPDITPNVDELAQSGIRFEQAYVQAPNCSPSRSVFQTSRYPHQSGMRGFYYVDADFKTLPEILKEHGYITGVLNKAADTSLSPDFDKYWDVNGKVSGAEKRSADTYRKMLNSFLKEVESSNKPFYCVVNVADPHKPFFNDPKSAKQGFDKFKPSKIFSLEDIEVPAFLPKHPKIKQETLNYYNSVKRGDDCVGAVMEALKKSKFYDNTIIVFVSDHGMPLPFAKSTIYQNGIRTPWIISWPNAIERGTVDKTHLISAIDFMPTVLDLLNLPKEAGMNGSSFKPQIFGKKDTNRKYVFAQFDENAGGIPRPSRSITSKKYGYVFNSWATGKYPFKCAAESYVTHKTMKALAETDEIVAKRFNHWVYRTVEELYDYEKDPDALNNLIEDPAYKEVADELRMELENWMTETNDYVLPAFQNKNNKEVLNKWMAKEDQKAIDRSKTIKWKRFSNRSGKTKKDNKLFRVVD